MKRKFHLRFLGGGEAVMPPRYPTDMQQTAAAERFLGLQRSLGGGR